MEIPLVKKMGKDAEQTIRIRVHHLCFMFFKHGLIFHPTASLCVRFCSTLRVLWRCLDGVELKSSSKLHSRGFLFENLHKGSVWSLCTVALVEHLYLHVTFWVAYVEARILGAGLAACASHWPAHSCLAASCTYSESDDWGKSSFSPLPSHFST